MYQHPATQANLEILRQRGAIILGPASGHLASGLAGVGRLLEPSELLGHLRFILGRNGPLQGRSVVVTAGGTQEPIDPVRTISNRSSGKQGFALAQAALDLGAQVTLITAPTHLPAPVGAVRVDVNTAEEMLHAVERTVRGADVLLMAAAVADFRPLSTADHKIKKDAGIPQIQLEKTPDILSAIASTRSDSGYPRLIVGFAAESEDLLENARAKLQSKHLDMIVANDISATDSGFAVDDNRVTLLDSLGGVEELPLMSKAEVAATVLQRVVTSLTSIA